MGIPAGLLIDHKGPRLGVLSGALCLACGYFPIHQGKSSCLLRVQRRCLRDYPSICLGTQLDIDVPHPALLLFDRIRELLLLLRRH